MKIAYIINRFSLAGAEIATWRLVMGMVARSHFVTLVILNKSELPDYKVAINLTIKNGLNGNIFVKMWRLRRILTQNFDIVHSVLENANIVTAFSTSVTNVTHIISNHNVDRNPRQVNTIKNLLLYILGLILYKRAKGHIAVSQASLEYYTKLYSLDRLNKRVIPNICQLSGHNKLHNIDESSSLILNDPYLLTIGRLEPVKGHIDLLVAYKQARIKCDLPKLVIIGSGSQLSALKSNIDQLDLNYYVVLLPSMSNVWPFYQNCSAYIHSALHEGFGITIVEAMSCRKLIIAYDQMGGTDYLISNFNCLLAMQDKRVSNLANTIVEASKNNFIYPTIIESAFETSTLYSEDRISALHSDFYASFSKNFK